MSIRWRITALVAVGVAVGLGFGSFVALWSAQRSLQQANDASLRAQADEIGALFQNGDTVPDAGLESALDDRLVVRVVIDGEPALVVGDASMLVLSDVDEVVASREAVYRDLKSDGIMFRLVTAPGAGDVDAVQVARELGETARAVQEMQRRRFGLSLFASAVAGVAAWLVVRREMHPFEELGAAVNRAAITGEFDRPVEVKGRGEVAQLARDFNSLLEAVNDSRDQQHRLVMDAGHELRTPLTSLRTSLELLDRGGLSPEDHETLRQRATREYLQLMSMADALVQLGTDAASAEALELCDLAEVVERHVAHAIRRHGDRFDIHSVESAPMIGQPELLGRAVGNLLTNAVKFSPPDAPIRVIVESDAVTVLDRGRGFRDGDAKRVFDRFYRSPSAQDVDGSGLGLSIVKYAAKAHNGSVFARNRPGGGAIVGFRIGPARPTVPVDQ